MSKKKSKDRDSEENTDEFNLNQITAPFNRFRVGIGNTLCYNDRTLIFQDGSTTIEFRSLPKFEKKKVSWRYGLVRDIVWSSELNEFILLTKDSLYTMDPEGLFSSKPGYHKPVVDLTVNAYSSIKPYNETSSFWRCAFADNTLYIIYAGYATIIDEYSLETDSCEFLNRWTPPKTCATHEGIWCIRYQPTTDQLGFAIMDTTNDEWRFEVRDRKNFSLLWQIELPFIEGDCEISPLPNGDWLAINARANDLVQIATKKLKSAKKYERELKNAIVTNDSYFAVRTKTAMDIHQVE